MCASKPGTRLNAAAAAFTISENAATPTEKFGAINKAPFFFLQSVSSSARLSYQPVVPTTIGQPASSAAWMFRTAAAGTENSTATSAPRSDALVTVGASPPFGSMRATTSIPRSDASCSIARPILPIPMIARRGMLGPLEEFGVEALHQRIHIVPVDDHREIDACRAQRQHVH